MAQTGFTPISIYYSATATNVPTAGNLVAGELAINTADGKLFYKDSSGVVQTLATKGGVGSATNTQVLYNSGGLVVGSANLTFNGTTLTAGGLTTTGATSTGTLSATGVATFSAGTVSLPAITTTGDTNTGIYFPAADTIAFTEGGVESMRIDSVGNVGIGTTSPTVYSANDKVLQISSGANGGAIKISNTATGATGGLLGYQLGLNSYLFNTSAGFLAFGTSNAESMRIDSTGNVGIGTSSPFAKLQVNGNIRSGNGSGETLSSGSIDVGADIGMADGQGIVSGAARIVTFRSSGNVGIGTSSPTLKLDVQGNQRTFSTSASTVYNLFQNSLSNLAVGVLSTGVTYIDAINAYPLTFLTTDTERMRIDSTGNVGIGTNSPAYKLDITGGVAPIVRLKSGTSGSAYYLTKNSTTDTLLAMGDATSIIGGTVDTLAMIYTSTSIPLSFYIGNSERMRIDSTGNVGIGTTPNAWLSGINVLQVKSGAFYSAGNEVYISANEFTNSSAVSIYKNTGFASLYAQNSGQHRFYTAPSGTAGNTITFTQAMTLDSSGNLIVGATSQIGSAKFGVQRSTAGEAIRWTDGATGGYIGTVSNVGVDFGFNANLLFKDDSTERMRIDSSGNLLVGNTVNVQSSKAEITSSSLAPALLARVNVASDEAQWAFQVQKTTATNTTAQVFIRFLINDGATASGSITANGAGVAAFTSTSDKRLKENIVELEPQLENIKALRPVEFDYKDGSGHQIGFIAQEMQTIYPDSVSENSDGMLQISGWSKTEARLVKAIQEQQTLINNLTTRLNALEGK